MCGREAELRQGSRANATRAASRALWSSRVAMAPFFFFMEPANKNFKLEPKKWLASSRGAGWVTCRMPLLRRLHRINKRQAFVILHRSHWRTMSLLFFSSASKTSALIQLGSFNYSRERERKRESCHWWRFSGQTIVLFKWENRIEYWILKRQACLLNNEYWIFSIQ